MADPREHVVAVQQGRRQLADELPRSESGKVYKRRLRDHDREAAASRATPTTS